MSLKGSTKMNIIDLIKKNDYSVILCLGDSITEANHCTEGHLGYVSLLDEALRLACGKKTYVLINAGIGGAQVSNSVEFLFKLVKRFKPQLTTFMYGMNDCVAGMNGLDEFSKSIETMIKNVRKQGSEFVLFSQNPIDYDCKIETIQKRHYLPDYMMVVRDNALKFGVKLVDINAIWQLEILDLNNNEHFKLMHDGIHPNQHGHRFIFEQIEKQLLI